MQRSSLTRTRATGWLAATLIAAAALSACSDHPSLTAPGDPAAAPLPATRTIQSFTCTGSTAGAVSCAPTTSGGGKGSAIIYGGQNVNVQLASSNVVYDSLTEIFSFDVTVKNLLNEVIGGPDATHADPDGIQVFFHAGPTLTSGSGTTYVLNADGTGTFTGVNQPYFAYHEILAKNQTSASKNWQLHVPNHSTFSFTVYIETDVQYLLVINEVLANPGGTITDTNGEWFEVYNAGTFSVNLQGLLIDDSATAGRRPYHVVGSSLSVPSGGYVVLGATTDTTLNGGAKVDYAYGTALALSNNVDAIKIARVYGTDTLTVDRVSYASAAVSGQNGISRELINSSLDNANVDGSNWANASITAIYGPGGRGTPKAQNSAFVP